MAETQLDVDENFPVEKVHKWFATGKETQKYLLAK